MKHELMLTTFAATMIAASSAFASAIAVDSDTILYLDCDTASFGNNLATASDKLTPTSQKNAVLKTVSDEMATLRDGMNGTDAANGGFVYGMANGSRAALSSVWSGASSYCDGDFTFECFVRLDSSVSSSDVSGKYLLRHSGAWMIQFDSDGKPVWKNKSWKQNISPTSIKDDKWHHLAVVGNRTTGTFAYYLDYALVSAAKYAVPAGSADGTIEINCGYGLGNNSASGMAYDEVRLVKRALTPQEFVMPPAQAQTFLAAAAALAKARRPVVTDDTFVYAPCDDAYLTHGSEMNALAGASGKPALALKLDDTSNTVMWASSAAAAPSPLYATSFADAASLANAGCLTLTGNGRMVMSDTSYLNDDFTLEFFFKCSSSELSAWKDNDAYLVHQSGAFYFRMGKANSGRVTANPGDKDTTPTTSYADGEWHHYAVVYEKASRRIRLYIDGERIASTTLSAELAASDTPLYIGAGCWSSGAYHVVAKGSYDEIRLTQKALRAVEFLSPKRTPVLKETKAYLNFDAGVDPGKMLPLVEAASVGYKANAPTFTNVTDDVAASGYLATARGTETFANAASLAVDLGASEHDGKGGGYVVADPDYDFSTGSWTAETFFKVEGSTKWYSYLFDCPDSWAVQFKNSGNNKLGCGVAGRDTVWTDVTLEDGQWHHVAVVSDADAKTISCYLDYKLLTCFENVVDPLEDGKTRSPVLYYLGEATNAYSVTMGPQKGWYDEMRLTKRALAVTEFETRAGAGLDATAMRLNARFEDGWASSAEIGSYSPLARASSAGATTNVRGRVSREILNASGEVVLTSRRGAVLTGGTVAYAGLGLFDEPTATCELFVKRTAGGADDCAVAFAKGTDAAQSFWKLTADGTFTVSGASATLSVLSLDDGAWHHLAVVHQTTDDGVSVTLYWDHASVGTVTTTAFAFGSGAGLVLGSSGFSGAVDEVRIFPRALEPAEHLYAAPPKGCVFIVR